MSKSLEERFWEKVDKSGGPDACWPWVAAVLARGHEYPYGQFRVGGRVRKAHQMAYEFATGTRVMPGLVMCHRCDFRLCCNPAHLFPGTQKENMEDASRKGRMAGCPGYLSEYTVRLVHVLHRLGMSNCQISVQVGISLSGTDHIVRGDRHRAIWEEFNAQPEYQAIGA